MASLRSLPAGTLLFLLGKIVSKDAGALLWGAREVQPESLQALTVEWPGSWVGLPGAVWVRVGAEGVPCSCRWEMLR